PPGSRSVAVPPDGWRPSGFATVAFTTYTAPNEGTTPSTTASTGRPSMVPGTVVPGAMPATPGAVVTRRRSRLASSTVMIGAPGATKAPTSTNRRVTIPANGAPIRV